MDRLRYSQSLIRPASEERSYRVAEGGRKSGMTMSISLKRSMNSNSLVSSLSFLFFSVLSFPLSFYIYIYVYISTDQRSRA